jgi:hypothetical protein
MKPGQARRVYPGRRCGAGTRRQQEPVEPAFPRSTFKWNRVISSRPRGGTNISDQSAPLDPLSDRKRIGVWENEGGGLDKQGGDTAADRSQPKVVPDDSPSEALPETGSPEN